jgi:hypothetical protein
MNPESFIPDFPLQSDAIAQAVVTTRREFAETAAVARGEAMPNVGGLFAHQRLFSRIMRIFTRMLLIAEPGTGKTVSFLAVTESLRNSGVYRAAYIIEKGDILIDEVVRQLFHNLAPGDLPPPGDARTGTLKRRAAPFYVFTTYIKFANEVKTMTDDEIVRRFSGCAFVLDEAHNITYNTKSDRYVAVSRVFALARRTVQILATATPMVNSREEISAMMNLILPRDRRFGKSYNFDAVGAEDDIAEKCLNYVSYVRAELPEVNVVYAGEALSRFGDGRASDTIVSFPSTFGDLQLEGYRAVEPRGVTAAVDGGEVKPEHDDAPPETGAPDDGESNAVYSASLQASMFVFPDGSFGGNASGAAGAGAAEAAGEGEIAGMGQYVEPVTREMSGGSQAWYEFKTTVPGMRAAPATRGFKSLKDFILGSRDPARPTANLARLSAKFASVIDIETTNYATPGTSFAYLEPKHGGGAILLGMCFELFGFERFDPKLSDLSVHRPRFAVLTPAPETSRETKDRILEVFRSDENVDGSLIKLIIGTRVTRDGTNLKHGVRFHLIQPTWTEAATIQAKMRVLRSDSHGYMSKVLGNRAREAGASPDEIAAAEKITVTIYRHVCVAPRARARGPVLGSGGELPSIDVYIQLVSAVKDLPIRRVMRALKRAAIDCSLNKLRNVTAPAESGTIAPHTQDCDYTECEYTCAGVARGAQPSRLLRQGEFATYNIVPPAEAMTRIAGELLRVARDEQKIKPADVGAPTSEVFRLAASRVINRFIPMRDSLDRRVYGFFFVDPDDPASIVVATTPNLEEVASMAAKSPAVCAMSEVDAYHGAQQFFVFKRTFRDAVLATRHTQFNKLLSVVAAPPPDPTAALLAAVAATGSSLALTQIYEYGFVLAVEAGAGAHPPIAGIISSAFKEEFKNKITRSRVRDIAAAIKQTTGDRVSANRVFAALDPDEYAYINVFLVDEERKVAGEYTSNVRGIGTPAAIAAATAGATRDPLSRLIRVFIPSEGLRAFRFVTPDLEAVAVEAALSKRGAESCETGDNAPFCGNLRARDGALLIVDRSQRKASWGRECTTFKSTDLVGYMYKLVATPGGTSGVAPKTLTVYDVLGKTVTAERIVNDVKVLAPDEEDVDAIAAKIFLKLPSSRRVRRNAFTINHVPKSLMCDFIKAELKARKLLRNIL